MNEQTKDPKSRPLSPDAESFSLKRQKPSSLFATSTSPSNYTIPTTSPPCTDWLLTTGNAHYVRSLSSFSSSSSYTPLREPITLAHNTMDPSTDLVVHGLGKVELDVQSPSPSLEGVSPEQGGSSHRILLENVLYIPQAICNGFSPVVFGGGMSCEEGIGAVGPGWIARPFAGGMRLVLAAGSGAGSGAGGGSEVVEGGSYSFGVVVGGDEWEGIFRNLETQGQGQGQGEGEGEGGDRMVE